jgi:hypothetical protein
MCREETLDGKHYLVFPMIMMVEGVHVNNGGASLYTAEQLSAIPEAWNTKPIVVLHPEKDGAPISACTKEVIEKQGIGIILNASYENGKLKAEAWIDVVKAEKVEPGLIVNLRTGLMLEVSIGHFSKDREEKGKWNNEEYTKIITDIIPDHLAILPNQVGACSVADGAGIPRINSVFDIMGEPTRRSYLADALLKEIHTKKISKVEQTDNLLSILRQEEKGDFEYIYEINGEKAELIQKMKKHRPEDKKENPINKKETVMNEEMKNMLKEKGFSEESIALCEGFSETEKQIFFSSLQTKEPEVKVNEKEEEKVRDISIEEYLNTIPMPFKEVLSDGVRLLNNKRDSLVKEIMSNKKNAFTKEELEEMGAAQLEKISKLAVNENYKMAGDVANNTGSSVTEEPMKEISLFEKKGD